MQKNNKTLMAYLEDFVPLITSVLFVLTAFHFNLISSYGKDNIIVLKSIDIGIFTFGFLITVMAILIQGNSNLLRKLREGNGFNRIIKYNRNSTILAFILIVLSIIIFGYYSDSILLMKIFFTVLFWMIFQVGYFLFIFYKLISSK